VIIKRFEDIDGWKAARELSNLVCDVTDGPAYDRNPKLRWQMQSAAGSAMDNIAEGFDSGSDWEFRRFLRIAKRSATEIQSQLYRSLDRRYIDEKAFRKIYAKCAIVKSVIQGFVRYLSRTERSRSDA
jgi:four helix bundle protein